MKVYCYSLNILKILYPGQKIISKQGLYQENVIYYSSTVKNVDLVLLDRQAVVYKAYKRKNVKIVPKSVIRHIEKLTEDRFEIELRLFMALGVWNKELGMDVKVYELFEALTESKKQFLTLYFILRRQQHVYELWSSILTFLIRVIHFKGDEATVSDYYKRIIKNFQNQSYKIAEIPKIIYGNHFNELLLLNILLSIR